MANAGRLRAYLGLDNSQFRRGLGESQGIARGFVTSMRGMIGPLAAGMAAAFSVAAVKGSAQAIDAQAKLAKSLDTTVESMQVLERAGELAGVSMGQIEQGTKDLYRRLSQAAAGTGPAKDALKGLGLSATDLLNMPLDQRISAINGAIQKFVPAAQQAAVAGALFGEEGSLLISRLDPAVIRQATEEIAAFGYAISETDAAKVEQANDAMSKLGLVGGALLNRITVALAPAINAMSQALGDLLGKGGLLRTILDQMGAGISLVVTVFSNLTTIVGAAVTDLVSFTSAAQKSDGVLGGVMSRVADVVGWLRSMIEGIGSALQFFADLIRASGGFGAALAALAPVAQEVWERIKMGGGLLAESLAGAALSIKAAFAGAWASVVEGFANMTGIIADGWNGLMSMMGVESNASGMGADLAKRLRSEADALASDSAAHAASLAQSWSDLVRTPLKSLQDLRDEVTRSTDETEKSMREAEVAANDLGAAFEGAGNKGAGGMEKTKAATDKAKEGLKDLYSSGKSAFVGLVSGAKSLREALVDVLGKWRDMLAENLFDRLFGGSKSGGGLLGGLVSAVLPSNAAGTPNFKGGLTRLNELGGEILDLPSGTRIIPHDVSQRMVGGGAQDVKMTINVDGARGDQHIVSLVEQGVRTGIEHFNRAILPDRVQSVMRHPRIR